jgi:flagellar basal body-associated protein FliL
MDKKLVITIIVALVLIILGIGGYFYWSQNKIQTPQEQAQQAASETTDILNNSVSQGVIPSIDTAQVNPLKDNPNINPVDKTNPFTNVKTNPFE